jgi:aspartyl-tRNA(Asn)/glutamyl-tRNA(Gln) amidotransferase subunit C
MDFTEEQFVKLTKLCRIECTDEEKKKLLGGLKTVLSYIELLSSVDTTGVAACTHVLEEMHNVMRADEVGETLPREVFLANAPSHIGGMIRVPSVMKG